MLVYNKNLKILARNLRKNMTDAERLVWTKLRMKQLKNSQFYRQKIIGNYIVDFYCPKAKLVIEIDGGQHYMDEGKKKDKKRDSYIKKLGLKVLRFSDRDVLKNISSVSEEVFNNL